ncbi:MAG: collagen-binding domain-containing protein [Phycisphaerales bacterium]
MSHNSFIRSVAAMTVLASGVAARADLLNDYNVVVIGNLSSNVEIEGRAFIGGNLTTGASSYGAMLLPRSSWLGVDVLTVGGNINGGNVHVEAGNLRLDGTRSGTIDFNGGGHEINDPTVSDLVPGYQSQLISTSNFLAALAANSTVTLPGAQPAPAVFNCVPNGQGVAIFTIAASVLSNNLVQRMDLHLNGATSVIINVTGGAATYNAGDMAADFTAANASRILWNFNTAGTVDTQRQFFGALLAPGATLSNSTTIVGSVGVNTFNQNGEVHLPNYTGYLPTPGAAGVLALGGLVASRRRR